MKAAKTNSVDSSNSSVTASLSTFGSFGSSTGEPHSPGPFLFFSRLYARMSSHVWKLVENITNELNYLILGCPTVRTISNNYYQQINLDKFDSNIELTIFSCPRYFSRGSRALIPGASRLFSSEQYQQL